MNPKITPRLEGLAFFTAATAVYFALGRPLWLFVALALVPDLSMLAGTAAVCPGALADCSVLARRSRGDDC